MTVALGLGAAAAWAVVNLWMVALSRRVDLGVTTLAVLASSTVVTLPLALAFEGAPAGGAWSHAPAAAAAGLLELAGLGCYILAIRKGSLAIVAPLVGLEGGIAALFAIAGGERVGVTVVAGILLAVLGTSLSCAERGDRRAAGAGWAIIAGGLFGLMFVMYGLTDSIEPFTAVTIGRLSALAVLVPILLRRPAVALARRDLWRLSAVGAVDAVAFGAFVAAVDRGPVSVASVCGAQFATISVILSVLLLRERPARVQVAGIVLTLAGTTLLAGAGG
ncbi:MAG TPA: EamA family transporter [Gaiellales bacterium]